MDLEPLQRRIGGTVIGRHDTRYEAARGAAVWNDLKPERRPESIVQVASAGDVVEAVRFAREHRVAISVRSGGHSWCGAALRDGSMLVDLSRLNDVAVDVPSRTAAVQPAAKGRELSARLAADGLAFPVGHCSTVTLGGYLLSGGFGWNGGAWGPACFSVAAIDVVTADGESRTADEQHDADLLWAARGAGAGFFGIVTRYHLRLRPLPEAITTSTFVFAPEHATRAARWAAEAAAELPRNVELMLSLSGTPAGSAGQGWVCAVVAVVFAATKEEAEMAPAPLLRRLPAKECLSTTLHRPTPFPVLFDGMDALFPHRHRYLAEALWSDAEPAELVEVARRHVASAPSARSLVLCPVPPPPGSDAPPMPDAAFSMTARSAMLCYAIWEDPQRDEANRAWHGTLVSALEPLTVGHYIGESDFVARPARGERSFSPASWRRLQTLRRKHDPERLFGGAFGS